MATAKGITQEEAPQQEENEVTRPSDLGFPSAQREIEVEPVVEPAPPPDNQGMVVIRMAQTIEEFTYGNPHRFVPLVQGKRYRVPIEVARYLDALGYVMHHG